MLVEYVYQLNQSENKKNNSISQVLAELIEANSTLKTVNAESNRLTGLVISEIVRSTLKNQTLLELRLSNQVNMSSFFQMLFNEANKCFYHMPFHLRGIKKKTINRLFCIFFFSPENVKYFGLIFNLTFIFEKGQLR